MINLLTVLLKLIRFAGIFGFVWVCVYFYDCMERGIFFGEGLYFRVLLLLILFSAYESIFDVGSDSILKTIAPGRDSRDSFQSDQKREGKEDS